MGKRTDILVRFGQMVRSLRTKAGHTQEEFADRCGLDRTYISGIERGRRNVSIRNVELIGDALGMTLAEMFRHLGS
jgi:transcriptional regulator with XRE-family HTH domain